MREEIKVVVFGVGGVGKELVKDLTKRKGLKLVGAVDIAPELVGKDAGVVAGCGETGVIINESLEAVCKEQKPDVVFGSGATPSNVNIARLTYEQMRPAVENGANVIVANSNTTNLWVVEPDLAKEIDENCKKHGVSYFGIGSSQVNERLVLALTEGSANIESITYTHHADVHAFPPESNKVTLGIGMTKAEYDEKLSGKEKLIEECSTRMDYMGKHLGWEVDDYQFEEGVELDEHGLIYRTIATVRGFEKGKMRIEENRIFILDPERRYYDRILIEGVPKVDSMNEFTPDRGMCTTFATMKNALPQVMKAEPGYINSLSLPACTLVDDDYRNHI
ncbi:MAG: hypothetical protein U0I51_06890 [Muricomes sp.]|uniref:hypothetical protein n=1 Tax=Faecalicatena contorta TaxID=39482 RepID=UPI002EB9BE1B|nr:hypothetical protein [Muricomes sp.]